MAVLVREIPSKRTPLWAAAEDRKLWLGGEFPFGLLQDLADSRGALSFYEVKSRRDTALIRIAAALHFPKANKDSKPQAESVEFRTVNLDDIAKLGINLIKNEGATRDLFVNDLHRDITGLTGPLAVRLARIMSNRATVVFSADQVAAAISDGIRKQQLPREVLHKQMVHSLVERGAATITYRAA